MNKVIPLRKPAARISPRVRLAVTRLVRHGATQVEAAKTAGLSRQGLGKALKRSEVQELVAQARLNLVAEADNLRAVGRVVALETALDLLQNSTDERIKVRMVEFLAADGKSPQVQVNVDARSIEPPATGYSYRRPDRLASLRPSEPQEGA